ncbi:MAG TPA: hypothetical protein VMJ34_03710 [Bryobacteraceae bacterium]|nr:hypothetical protein [Bryobacteraceae bacterium]
MFKRILHFSTAIGTPVGGPSSGDATSIETAAKTDPVPAASIQTSSGNHVRLGSLRSFEEIYKSAPAQPPRMLYGILKISEMLNSSHLTGMSHESKRCSVMMAVEAAGVQVEDLLQDAMLRQRALNEYEQGEEFRIKDFEASIDRENNQLQAELERLTAQYMARIQANIDEVAAAQDRFRAWQKRKAQELQHISAAAAICVPKGAENNGNASYNAVLARCGVENPVGAR